MFLSKTYLVKLNPWEHIPSLIRCVFVWGCATCLGSRTKESRKKKGFGCLIREKGGVALEGLCKRKRCGLGGESSNTLKVRIFVFSFLLLSFEITTTTLAVAATVDHLYHRASRWWCSMFDGGLGGVRGYCGVKNPNPS